MKKLLYLFLLAPFFLNGQNITETNFEGFHWQYNFILQNGNTLNIAAVDLDNTTAESECQCTEYQFGQRLWVFETDHNFEIINERCFSNEDFQLILNENWVPAINNNVFPYNCNTPSIYDVFYEGDEIVFHLWEGSYGYNYNGETGFSSGIGTSILVKFDLEQFNFYDPIPYSVDLAGAGMYMVVDKTFKLETSPNWVNMNLHYRAQNPPPSNWNSQNELISRNGYQDLHLQSLSGVTQYGANLTEIFAGNSVEVILDYKQNSSSIISFLVIANSLDGLYSEGVQYETSLFIIEVDFSDTYNLEYDVVKSQLEIPRDTDLRYENYTVFIDNNNNFVFNIKQQQQSDFVMEDYNKLHFLNDDGSYDSINLDNDFSLEWSHFSPGQGTFDWSINLEQTWRYYHKIVDIAFSEENFMTLEKAAIRQWNSNSGETIDQYGARIFKVFDYEGILLHRYVLSHGPLAGEVATSVVSNLADDITTIYTVGESYWYDTFTNIAGVNTFGSGYLVNNFANNASCGTNAGGSSTILRFTEMNTFNDPTLTASVEVIGDNATFSIATTNFTIGQDADSDGHWHYSLNGGDAVMVYTTEEILTDLPNGDHTILIWLVDSEHNPLDPAVEQTIEFSTFNGLAECDEAVVYSQVADGDYSISLATDDDTLMASVTINATMEVNYDSIIITDGAGNQLNTQIDGDFVDADFYSTDGTITVQVLNDSSIQNGDVTLEFACVSLSITENEILDMIIYPNPVLNGDFVTIQTSVNGEKYVEVFDITGKRLITTTLSADTLGISVLSSGIYLVNVTINGKSEISKLIIR